MNAVGKLGDYISRGVVTVSAPFHPFGGAVDIVVVEQPDGSFKSSPWYVRFGKFQGVLNAKEKVVCINVNGIDADFRMYLNSKGAAHFLREMDEDEGMSESIGSSNHTDAGCNYEFEPRNHNKKKMIRSNSTGARKLGFVFGRRSWKENVAGRDREASLERAEIAADLLEVKWSTGLAITKSGKGSALSNFESNALHDKGDTDIPFSTSPANYMESFTLKETYLDFDGYESSVGSTNSVKSDAGGMSSDDDRRMERDESSMYCDTSESFTDGLDDTGGESSENLCYSRDFAESNEDKGSFQTKKQNETLPDHNPSRVNFASIKKKMVWAKTPTSEQLTSLNLKQGRNEITFTFSTPMMGEQQVDAHIHLWKWNARIVISDVDGTITKSDVLGQFMPLVGVDWSQTGVAHLYSAIKENGYELFFLSARAISQASLTRQFLFNLKQDGKALPEGPVVISPDGLFPSLIREVIRRAPHEFKIACLEAIRALFPSDHNPFYAGFGNRDTDELSYLKVGIPKGKIFIINPRGEVAVQRRVDKKSYTSLHTLVHDMFPPPSSISSSEQEDFNSWNFWRLPPSEIVV